MISYREIHCLNRLLARMSGRSETVGEAVTRVLREAEERQQPFRPGAVRALAELYAESLRVAHLDLSTCAGGILWMHAEARKTLKNLPANEPALLIVTGLGQSPESARVRTYMEDFGLSLCRSAPLQLLFV